MCVSIQKHAYSFLLANHFPFDYRRHVEWHFGKLFCEEFSEQYVEYALNNVKGIKNIVPPRVLFVLIQTWSNDWCSASRFQEGMFFVWLCNDCLGDDSILHYSSCKHGWDMFESKFRSGITRRNAFSLLCVDPELSLEQCTFLAIHLYALKRAVDTNRNRGVRPPKASVPSLLWQGHKTAMMYSSKVREMFRDHWNSPHDSGHSVNRTFFSRASDAYAHNPFLRPP